MQFTLDDIVFVKLMRESDTSSVFQVSVHEKPCVFKVVCVSIGCYGSFVVPVLIRVTSQSIMQSRNTLGVQLTMRVTNSFASVPHMPA